MSNTREQDLAIRTIDKNLAVNAGAGTGKTKVLTERYLYILENGNLEKNKEVESIVAITFTKKAAQEMKDRIREEIRKRFSQGSKWRRFYRDLEKANISTIHSFCANMIRENPLKAKVDPMFKVIEQSEGDLLLEEVIQDKLLKGIEEDEQIYSLIRLFKKDDISRIVEELINIYHKVRTAGFSFEQVKYMTLSHLNSFSVDEEDVARIRELFRYLIGRSRKNTKLGKLSSDEVWIKFNEGSNSEEELIPMLEYLLDNIGTSKQEQDTIDELKYLINKVLHVKEKDNLWAYETFLDLLIDIDREYRRRKDEIGSLDFDDLQIFALKLLEDESIREEYQEKYRYIMVDEFQDTNEVQKQIFYKLCSKENLLDRNNLFVVGDPKQSIYGFRGADLDVFYQVVEDIERVSNQKPISLDKNFRTVDTVLNFINSLFSQIMGERYISLKEHHNSNNKIDVEILEKEGVEPPTNVSRTDYDLYIESRLIAARIKELVEKEAFNYGDFCLLFRATTNDYIYEDALKEYGIPYYNFGGKGLFESQEIKDLMNGLKAISNRYDTIATIGFLRSPMIGLSDRTLYWLLRNKRDNLLNTLEENIPHIENKEREKANRAKAILNEFIIKKDLYSVSKLVSMLIARTYYLDSLMMLPGGKQMVSNVNKFMDICMEYDRNSLGSLEDFIDYIEMMKSKGNLEESQAKIYTEDANVVKLMTIHKSKGLQFPVTIIPQMARGFKVDNSFGLFDKNMGIGLKLDENSPFYKSIREEIKKREEEENQRILYVAMTRAQKRLIIGWQGRDSGFKKMVKDFIDMNQVTFIDTAMEKPSNINVFKPLKPELFEVKAFDKEKFPLVMQIDGFGHKKFRSFSISQFLDFNQCKRKFYMKYYRKLPIDIIEDEAYEGQSGVLIDGITKGNIIHSFCQYYNRGKDKRELLKQIVNSYGIDYNDEIEDYLSPYVDNYLKYFKDDYDQIYSEKEFFLKVEDAYIKGIIDRINVKGNSCEIVDFKTNRIVDLDKLKSVYTPQVKLYANALKRITNWNIKGAYILFLETGDKVEVDVSETSLEENLKTIMEFIHFVNNHSSIEDYEKACDCNHNCVYSIMCNHSIEEL